MKISTSAYHMMDCSGDGSYEFRSEAYIFRPMVEMTRNLFTVRLQSNDLDRISAPDTVPDSKHDSTFALLNPVMSTRAHLRHDSSTPTIRTSLLSTDVLSCAVR